ncbi:MAG: hypothetical protein R3Y57_04905 [Erysipelotrichaceae bacterium]
MKKIITLICLALLLTGCATSGSGAISDPDTAIITVGDTTITKGSVYNMMYESYGASQIIADTLEYISNQEIETTDAMYEEAQASITMQTLIYGDTFEELLIANGFASTDDYIERIIIPSLKVSALTEKYIEINFDSMQETYTPKKIQVMSFTDLETAEKALSELASGTEFTQVATDNSSTAASAETVYTVKSDYPIDVKVYIADATEDNQLSDVIYDAENGAYYIVLVTSADVNSFKEEAIATIATLDDVEAQSFDYYLDLYEFSVYDETLYNQIKATYPDYLD